MWDNDLDRAKAAIERKDYQAARTILEMMPDNLIARDWLRKLNRKSFKFRHEKSYTPRPALSSPERRAVPIVAIVIIGLNMLFWAVALLLFAMMNPLDSQTQARVVLAVVAALVGLPILYYVFWRWFWWALAAGWLLLTFGFIIALAQGWQIPILFPSPS